MSKIDHTTPFRLGDRVRAAEIDRIGQRTGAYRTGTVLPSPADDGFVRVRVDGITMPVVYAAGRLELAERNEEPPDCGDPENNGDYTARVIGRMNTAIDESGMSHEEVSAATSIPLDRLEACLAADVAPTITEVEVIGIRLGCGGLSLLVGEEFGDALELALRDPEPDTHVAGWVYLRCVKCNDVIGRVNPLLPTVPVTCSWCKGVQS